MNGNSNIRDKTKYIYVIGRKKNGRYQIHFKGSQKKLKIGKPYIGMPNDYTVLDILGWVKYNFSDFHVKMYISERESKYISILKKIIRDHG